MLVAAGQPGPPPDRHVLARPDRAPVRHVGVREGHGHGPRPRPRAEGPRGAPRGHHLHQRPGRRRLPGVLLAEAPRGPAEDRRPQGGGGPRGGAPQPQAGAPRQPLPGHPPPGDGGLRPRLLQPARHAGAARLPPRGGGVVLRPRAARAARPAEPLRPAGGAAGRPAQHRLPADRRPAGAPGAGLRGPLAGAGGQRLPDAAAPLRDGGGGGPRVRAGPQVPPPGARRRDLAALAGEAVRERVPLGDVRPRVPGRGPRPPRRGPGPQPRPGRARDHREVGHRELRPLRGGARRAHPLRVLDRGRRRGGGLLRAREDRPPQPALPEVRPRAHPQHRLELHPPRDDARAQGLRRPDRVHDHRRGHRARRRAADAPRARHRVRPGVPARPPRRRVPAAHRSRRRSPPP